MVKIKEEEHLLNADRNEDRQITEKTSFGPNAVDTGSGDHNEERPTCDDAPLSPPAPSPRKRIMLIVAIILLFYLGFKARAALVQDRKPSVIYASRYSKEHKFRPAASPVITETLKDGRTRLRGALPTPTTTATATPTKAAAKKRRSSRTGRATGKGRRKRAPAVAKQ